MDCCPQINTKFLNKLLLSLWVCVAMHVQRTLNKKVLIHLQYFKESVKDEVDFLLAVKHQRFLQIDTIILGVWPGIPKLQKKTSLLFVCNVFRKKSDIKWIFWMQIIIKVSFKLILWFLLGMVKHSQSFNKRS